jgi:hypothetical protein
MAWAAWANAAVAAGFDRLANTSWQFVRVFVGKGWLYYHNEI